jgi:hypothetical protein
MLIALASICHDRHAQVLMSAAAGTKCHTCIIGLPTGPLFISFLKTEVRLENGVLFEERKGRSDKVRRLVCVNKKSKTTPNTQTMLTARIFSLYKRIRGADPGMSVDYKKSPKREVHLRGHQSFLGG